MLINSPQVLLAASCEQLPEMTPQGVSNTIWALARLGIMPGPRWLGIFMEESFLRMGMLNAQVRLPGGGLWPCLALGTLPDKHCLWEQPAPEAMHPMHNTAGTLQHDVGTRTVTGAARSHVDGTDGPRERGVPGGLHIPKLVKHHSCICKLSVSAKSTGP